MTTKSEMHVGRVLREYIVEYLNVTAKTHSFKGERVLAGSKEEAFNLCKRMTKTGRVKEASETLSCLRVVQNSIPVTERGCRVF